MPDDQNRLGVGGKLGEPGDGFTVCRVGEPLGSLRNRQPQQLIDFVAGDEGAAVSAGNPVVNDLGAARDWIGHRRQAAAQMCALAGLLEDLPNRSNRFGLTGIELALRQ